MFSKPLGSLVDDRLPCSVAEAEVEALKRADARPSGAVLNVARVRDRRAGTCAKEIPEHRRADAAQGSDEAVPRVTGAKGGEATQAVPRDQRRDLRIYLARGSEPAHHVEASGRRAGCETQASE